jgi:hypothetical protein
MIQRGGDRPILNLSPPRTAYHVIASRSSRKADILDRCDGVSETMDKLFEAVFAFAQANCCSMEQIVMESAHLQKDGTFVAKIRRDW